MEKTSGTAAPVVFHLRRLDDPAGSNPHRVQLAIKLGLPEVKKCIQFGEFRAQIVFLPDEGLEQGRVIGPAIKDLGRRQPVAIQDLG